MKKFGFTLAEILITLGIIGVASALVAPTITNIIPDKNKVAIVKIYGELTKLNDQLLTNNGIYFTKYTFNSSTSMDEPACYGFGCADEPLTAPFNTSTYSGLEDKYPRLVAYHLSRNNSTEYSSFNCYDGGTTCMITSKSDSSTFPKAGAIFTVKFNNGKDCLYGDTDCKKPGKHQFYINTFGAVTPGDALTQAYLENPLQNSQRKKDYARAEELKSKTYTYSLD